MALTDRELIEQIHADIEEQAHAKLLDLLHQHH